MKISYSTVPTVFLFAFISLTATAHAATPAAATPSIEAQVREYFKDAPAMIEIARCESKFRQFTDAGNVLRGGASGGMVGVFQFYESIHAPAAKALGFDLSTLQGNLAYARHVYETEGTNPWNSSRYCWDVPGVSKVATTFAKPVVAAAPPVDRAALQQKIVMLTKLIALLQQQLAAKQHLPLV